MYTAARATVMPWKSILNWIVGLAIAIAVLITTGGALQSQSLDELDNLEKRIGELYPAGRFGEAIPLAERALELTRTRKGDDHRDTAAVMGLLAELLREQGRYTEAEPLYVRALAIDEAAGGPDNPDVAVDLNNLALLYRAQGRYGAAVPIAQRAIGIWERSLGPEHTQVATGLNNLASIYLVQGRYVEASPLFKRSLVILEKVLGSNHVLVGRSLSNLAAVSVTHGPNSEGEPLYNRSLAILRKTVGPDHPYVAETLNNLAALYHSQGRYAEAEPLYKHALEIDEKALGRQHPSVGNDLNLLASFYYSQRRYEDAEPLIRRSILIREGALGSNHPEVALSLNNLAELNRVQGRFGEAEPHYRRALAIYELALGPDHHLVSTALNNLALSYFNQGRFGEAEPLYKRSLAIVEKLLGPEHPSVANVLNNLAGLYADQEKFDEALRLQNRALAIDSKTFGTDHPTVAGHLNNLGGLYAKQSDWPKAADHLRRASAILMRRAGVGTAQPGPGRSLASAENTETQAFDWYFRNFDKAAYRTSQDVGRIDPSLTDEAFRSAQWAMASDAAASLSKMAARGASGSPALASLVRERQDLVDERQRRDQQRTFAVAQPPERRSLEAEVANSARLTVIDAHINEIDKRLVVEFPDYADLASPRPLSVEQVQAELNAGEALVLFLDTPEWKPTPEETFIWVITKTEIRWVRSSLGTPGLAREVATLRCGLDREGAWDPARGGHCQRLFPNGTDTDPLPFDLQRAHQLYQALFGQVEDLIRDKHLLIVPSGPLTALPFQVLVTEQPSMLAAPSQDPHSYSNAAWLAKRHAVTVLPSVSSLKSLRQFAKVSKARAPFIGFGNPLLVGPNGDDKRAWGQQSCKGLSGPVQIASRGVRAAISRFFRGGLANVDEVRAQYPLPETADELCAVAQSAGAGQEAVYLGEKASEKAIKALSANGDLVNVRVVHFATHGLLASETEIFAASRAEPALILSPPAQATEEDDGLLTASEITQLKLDADWVVLSACNTAAGGSAKPGAEALSGLARAFFYAGARAMLVSHWAVNSEATVKLITKTFDEIKVDPKIGRAEALRRSMLALVATGSHSAHPANWAPFVVVGEGAAAR
jgi:CHAT domain-containing protein/tetratricopeptide (TPR) repeat protein